MAVPFSIGQEQIRSSRSLCGSSRKLSQHPKPFRTEHKMQQKSKRRCRKDLFSSISSSIFCLHYSFVPTSSLLSFFLFFPVPSAFLFCGLTARKVTMIGFAIAARSYAEVSSVFSSSASAFRSATSFSCDEAICERSVFLICVQISALIFASRTGF